MFLLQRSYIKFARDLTWSDIVLEAGRRLQCSNKNLLHARCVSVLSTSAEAVACWANEFLMESKQSACPAPAQNAIGNTAWTLTTEAYRILLDELHHTKPNRRGTEADTETAGPCCIWKLFSSALALEISLRDQARANVMHACIPCLGRLAVRVNDRSTNSHRTDRP